MVKCNELAATGVKIVFLRSSPTSFNSKTIHFFFKPNWSFVGSCEFYADLSCSAGDRVHTGMELLNIEFIVQQICSNFLFELWCWLFQNVPH